MSQCRICGSVIKPFMSFGKMPIANGFLTSDGFSEEYFFELAPAICANCSMVQIIEQPDPARMFHENYAFFSGTSKYMQVHFREFATSIQDRHLSGAANPFVVELGSNDGIMLRNFAAQNIAHLGIEPSRNVAEVAQAEGVNTICEFFGETLAKKIVGEYGQADVLLAANVMCHIPDLNGVAMAAHTLLKPGGVMVFEDPYLGDVVEKTSYDQIYDEHVFVFCALSVVNAFGRHDFELVDVEPQVTHGGSMRYTLAKKGAKQPGKAVAERIARETQLGLGRAETFERFRENCEASRQQLMTVLEDLRTKGAKVAGYGATSKSTTVMNYCGITPDHISYISDTTPTKQGKYSPGTHVPIKPYEDFVADYPEYAVLFAWNHSREIMEKEQGYKAAGGKWINFVPKVTVEE
ncbi:MAG: class I SAM-dependent methyltransferase [Rhodospirillaceae bacterium]|nr:class I SAM-dependent methyltransferase [Rhodospirillaceae bacterium]MBT5242879.1 class I SAM-dependent methyltransferase [Rhodospirillaceae bacterium]MBT5563103.1 class I SAM-dependent methyltransferase [Rhodospirillaceae bacterium]MBT6243418.1 class I SAM-dependent methyltransferase [Rhodospirillaceae bacterium]MBT7138511.1 class I SAM-dependent methyltransferase [Rhodospirillaceae bacterium]